VSAWRRFARRGGARPHFDSNVARENSWNDSMPSRFMSSWSKICLACAFSPAGGVVAVAPAGALEAGGVAGVEVVPDGVAGVGAAAVLSAACALPVPPVAADGVPGAAVVAAQAAPAMPKIAAATTVARFLAGEFIGTPHRWGGLSAARDEPIDARILPSVSD
jgi:hypothetical protein